MDNGHWLTHTTERDVWIQIVLRIIEKFPQKRNTIVSFSFSLVGTRHVCCDCNEATATTNTFARTTCSRQKHFPICHHRCHCCIRRQQHSFRSSHPISANLPAKNHSTFFPLFDSFSLLFALWTSVHPSPQSAILSLSWSRFHVETALSCANQSIDSAFSINFWTNNAKKLLFFHLKLISNKLLPGFFRPDSIVRANVLWSFLLIRSKTNSVSRRTGTIRFHNPQQRQKWRHLRHSSHHRSHFVYFMVYGASLPIIV